MKTQQLLKETHRKVCGSCLENLYSPFDVLFNHKYSACLDCYSKDQTDEEIEAMSQVIFSLI